MKEDSNCIVINKTKGTPIEVGVPFVSIKNAILGIKYNLEIVFLSQKEQQKLNRIYRKKDKTTNVLSFALSPLSGLITLDPEKIKKESPLFFMSYTDLTKFLLIHGCLHLKGFEHSSTMEKEEEKFLKKFS